MAATPYCLAQFMHAHIKIVTPDHEVLDGVLTGVDGHGIMLQQATHQDTSYQTWTYEELFISVHLINRVYKVGSGKLQRR